MKITELGADSTGWDRYVEAHPQASFFHLAAWRDVLAHSLGHRPHYLIAHQDGAVAGVLPLMQQKTMLFGHSLISLPFCVYGGPLAQDDAVRRALLAEAIALRGRLGAPALELRYLAAPDAGDMPGWTPKTGLYATFRRAISGDDETNMKAIPRKQRAMVRKGIERKLRSDAGTEVDGLYRIYAESVRNLGTPVFPRRYFRLLAETFAGRMDVVTVRTEETALAAVMNFYWRDEVLPYYGGSIAQARTLAASDFMYWEVMRRAAARGARLFDFGRSKEGTGPYAFKKNWGFVPQPLTYYFSLQGGAALPEVNPLNPKYRLMIAAWKRLPLPIANLLGPHLVRGAG